VGSKKKQVIIGMIIGLGFMALPLFIEGYWIRVLSSIFMYAIITGALNIIAGFAGYAAFGNIVFSGIGAKPNFDSCEPTLDAWIGNRPKVN